MDIVALAVVRGDFDFVGRHDFMKYGMSVRLAKCQLARILFGAHQTNPLSRSAKRSDRRFHDYAAALSTTNDKAGTS